MWLLRKLFGPCFRRPHDWRPTNHFGLRALVNECTCSRCGAVKTDFATIGGIDRRPGIWKTHHYDHQ